MVDYQVVKVHCNLSTGCLDTLIYQNMKEPRKSDKADTFPHELFKMNRIGDIARTGHKLPVAACQKNRRTDHKDAQDGSNHLKEREERDLQPPATKDAV